MKLGIVGCGVIARPYARTIAAAQGLELVAAADALPGRAQALVDEFGGTAHESVDAILADDRVETIVNLTAATAHVEVSSAALEEGKHVYSEKPMALGYADARALVELAEARGLALGSAPATLLGEAQQTLWKLVREGAVGKIRVIYAEANWGHIESWHPTPATIYAVGAAADVGVYPLAILTAIFGPARRVTAYAATVQPDRIDKHGTPFHIESPDFVVAVLELESVVVRLTASFYAGAGRQRGIELYGDDGIIHLGAWDVFHSGLQLSTTGDAEDYEDVPLVREPHEGVDWSRALADLAEGVHEGRPPRASGAQAAHLVEILDAIETSRREGGAVEVRSSFPPPPPLEWAL